MIHFYDITNDKTFLCSYSMSFFPFLPDVGSIIEFRAKEYKILYKKFDLDCLELEIIFYVRELEE